jgi:hypothetical protein
MLAHAIIGVPVSIGMLGVKLWTSISQYSALGYSVECLDSACVDARTKEAALAYSSMVVIFLFELLPFAGSLLLDYLYGYSIYWVLTRNTRSAEALPQDILNFFMYLGTPPIQISSF